MHGEATPQVERAPEQAALTRAVEQMAKVLGADEAERVLAECMRGLALDEVRSPQDLLRIADRLVQAGGFVAVVGGSLRVQAILAGARPAAA